MQQKVEWNTWRSTAAGDNSTNGRGERERGRSEMSGGVKERRSEGARRSSASGAWGEGECSQGWGGERETRAVRRSEGGRRRVSRTSPTLFPLRLSSLILVLLAFSVPPSPVERWEWKTEESSIPLACISRHQRRQTGLAPRASCSSSSSPSARIQSFISHWAGLSDNNDQSTRILSFPSARNVVGCSLSGVAC